MAIRVLVCKVQLLVYVYAVCTLPPYGANRTIGDRPVLEVLTEGAFCFRARIVL